MFKASLGRPYRAVNDAPVEFHSRFGKTKYIDAVADEICLHDDEEGCGGYVLQSSELVRMTATITRDSTVSR